MRFSFLVLAFGLAAACSSKPKATEAPKATEPTAAMGATAAGAVKAVEKSVETATTAMRTECATKGDSRVLELRPKGKGCELGYTKNGQEGIVASSANGNAYCETAMNKIRDRLKGSGFECK